VLEKSSEAGSTKRPLLDIEVDQRPDAIVLHVAGEIGYLTVGRFRGEVREALARTGGCQLVLDLTDVTFLGSAGIAALAESAWQAQDSASDFQPLRIVVDHAKPVIRPMEITGMDELLVLHTSVGEALEA
jgi:anti-sigma B factor antagonist